MTIIARRPEDELLLLASDGLWDVLSNQEAVTLAKRCLRRARQRGASRQSAARIAGELGLSDARPCAVMPQLLHQAMLQGCAASFLGMHSCLAALQTAMLSCHSCSPGSHSLIV